MLRQHRLTPLSWLLAVIVVTQAVLYARMTPGIAAEDTAPPLAGWVLCSQHDDGGSAPSGDNSDHQHDQSCLACCRLATATDMLLPVGGSMVPIPSEGARAPRVSLPQQAPRAPPTGPQKARAPPLDA
jgi:hypothetical protein